MIVTEPTPGTDQHRQPEPEPPAGAEPVGPVLTRGTRVQSVDRAVALLRAIARTSGAGTTAAALATACGLNRATAWRLLTTLEAGRIVSCDRRTGQWSIGIGLVEIAGAGGVDALVRSARSALERLSRLTGETAALGVVRSGRLTYVDEVTPPALVSASWRGRTAPLHATSSGKVVLAFLPEAEAAALIGDRLTGYTDRTISDRDALEAELGRIRQSGYGVCRGEFEATAWGVSAPVLDPTGAPHGVISLWGPRDRLTEDRFETLGELVVAAAADLSPRP